jgi:hypothetical protein
MVCDFMQTGGKAMQKNSDQAHKFQSFAEFWPFYIEQHSHPKTRLLHFCGSTISLVMGLMAVVTANPWFIVVAVGIGYSFAWYSHFFIEENRPATFGHPIWSFRADVKMWFLMITGRMGAEAELNRRLLPNKHPKTR